MTPMQSRTNKLTLILLCCLALAGFAGLDLCRDGGGDRRPTMQIQPPTAPEARAPVAQGAIPDQTLVEGATETLDVEPYFTDPDGDSLTYTVAVVSGASSVTVAVSGSELTIRGLVAGTAGVRVTATDPGGLTAEQDFTVRVEAVVEIPPPCGVSSRDASPSDASSCGVSPCGARHPRSGDSRGHPGDIGRGAVFHGSGQQQFDLQCGIRGPLCGNGRRFRQRGDDERASGRYDGSGACDGDGSRRIVRVLGFHRRRSGTDTIAAFP